MVYNWLNFVRNGLFPTHCRLCLAQTRPGMTLCPGCYRELPWLARGCASCTRPLPADSPTGHCPACRQHPPALDACHALFDYRPPVDQWIRRLKFHQELGLAKLFGILLAAHAPRGEQRRLVPVPLHRRRLRQRGFNQALEIARPLRERGYIIDTRCCARIRHTPPQSQRSAAERRDNLRDAFAVRGEVAGASVLLVDDVLTTGATLNALAGALKQAGAVYVEARVIARTPPPGRERAGSDERAECRQ